jgi:two-component system, NtrC family, nitrogen regulation sensor histidine kinase NtrY
MNNLIERYKFLILGIIFIISGVVIETNVFDRRFGLAQKVKFESVLSGKIAQSDGLLAELAHILGDSCSAQGADCAAISQAFAERNKSLMLERGIDIALWVSDTLVYWSQNKSPIPSWLQRTEASPRLHNLGSAWYFAQQHRAAGYTIVTLTLIKYQYPFSNDFLRDGFHRDFNVPEDVSVSPERKPGYYSIFCGEGRYLMSIGSDQVRNSNEIQKTISVVLYLLGIAIIILFSHFSIQRAKKFRVFAVYNIAFAASVCLLRWLMYSMQLPYIFHSAPLFSPAYFAYSEFLASLGDLFINSLLFLLFSVQLFFFTRRLGVKMSAWQSHLASAIFSGLMFMMFAVVLSVLDSLVTNSSINLEPHKILQVDVFTFVAYMVIASLMFAYLVLSYSIVSILRAGISCRMQYLWALISSSAFLLLIFLGAVPADDWSPVVFFAVQAYVIYICYTEHKPLRFRIKVPAAAAAALFIVLYVQQGLSVKREDVKRLYAESLENEQDPIAEILLEEIGPQLEADLQFKSLARRQSNTHAASQYLVSQYFSGYFSKYELVLSVCSSRNTDCQHKLDRIADERGAPLGGSFFYFIDNKDGSISYLSKIPLGSSVAYIELVSKLGSELLGYPELLLDSRIKGNKLFSDFSFGKYRNGQLVARKGKYSYNNTSQVYAQLSGGQGSFSHEGYSHYMLRSDEKLSIVISSPETTLFETLVSFSYVFLFLFLMLALSELANIAAGNFSFSRLNFKLKIQVAIVGVLSLSLILIGLSLLALNRQEYMRAQVSEVRDKMRSVLAELEMTLENKKTITPADSDFLAKHLSRHSGVFFSDMHLYSLNGNLLASSRPEIFKHELCGPQMQPDAFWALSRIGKAEFMHEESIGLMGFLSAYALVRNSDGHPLAYLNLPYFSKQTLLSERLSSLAAALINIFVLMIVLSVGAAVFVANKVTYPLRLLKERLSSISLSGKNEMVEWDSDDEIGQLIADYNRMVMELEDSAGKLAHTERLAAWHQMAKQVAHEIKNPLTPMKLNIQFLKRAWESRDEKFGIRLDKIAASLIEQIDALANTATEFGSFSKTEPPVLAPVNLYFVLDSACLLFEKTPSAELIRLYSEDNEVNVLADKEKLLRVFNNIIKNAIQSIPPSRHGEIVVSVKTDSSHAAVSIRDNGTGIPAELEDKLFQPNFTTKSSGTGLGLGIVKGILDSMGSQIEFSSKEGVGTTFTIYLPLAKS